MPARGDRVEAQEPSDTNVWFPAEYESVIGPPGKRCDYKKKAFFDAAKSIFDRKGGWHRVVQLSGRQPRVVEHVRWALSATAHAAAPAAGCG